MPEHRFEALGHRIAIDERGDAGARAVVILHALTGDRRLLAEVLDEPLERAGLRRLYVDLPGHGASTGNAAAAAADDLVRALAALILHGGGTAPLLVGYSYGAYLGLGLLRDVPLGGALLVCPVVEPDFGRRLRLPRQVARPGAALAFDPADPQEQATFEEVAVVQSAEVLAAYRRLVMPASRAADRAFVEAVRQRYVMARPLYDRLGEVTGSVAIVCGHRDHWVGFEDAARLARALPDASLHVLAGCGQLLPLEEPARLRALCADWLARTELARTGLPGTVSGPPI